MCEALWTRGCLDWRPKTRSRKRLACGGSQSGSIPYNTLVYSKLNLRLRSSYDNH